MTAAVCAGWLAAGAVAQEPTAAQPAAEAPAPPTEADILSFLEEQAPEVYEILSTARISDPEAYQRQLRALGEQIAFYEKLRQRSPEQAERLLRAQHLAIRTRSVSDRIRATAPGAERDELAGGLRDLLAEEFELELAGLEADVASLAETITRLQERIARRRASRDAVVESRLRSLTEEAPPPAP